MVVQERPAGQPATVVTSVGLTIALCFCVALLEGFDIQALGISLGKLTKQFGLDANQRTMLTTFSSVGIVLGAILGGRVADFLGRKPVLLWAVSGFGVFTLATVAAPSFLVLFVCRVLAGVGFGAALPMMMAIAAEISTPERQAITAAMMFCGMPVGGGSSGLLVQYLGPDFDWRVLFAIGGLIPLLLVPAVYFLLPETRARQVVRQEAPGAIGEALFADGRLAPTLLLWITFLPTLTILYLILNWLPTLIASKGFGGTVSAQATMLFNYGSVFGALLFGHFVDRLGVRWPLVLSYAALIVCLLALGGTTDVTPALVLSGLAGFLLLGANYAMYGAAAAYYPLRVRGTGSGACISIGRIGSVIGPLLAGIWLGGGASAAQVIGYMAPFAAAAGVAVYLLGAYKHSES
jgi:AAHS family 3-hydroxyphenylpropionic acid transporter